MKKGSFLAGMLTMALLCGICGTAYAAVNKRTLDVDYADIKISLDGETFTPRDVNGVYVEPFAYQGTTYLPIRAVSEALGLSVEWDAGTHTVILMRPEYKATLDAAKIEAARRETEIDGVIYYTGTSVPSATNIINKDALVSAPLNLTTHKPYVFDLTNTSFSKPIDFQNAYIELLKEYGFYVYSTSDKPLYDGGKLISASVFNLDAGVQLEMGVPAENENNYEVVIYPEINQGSRELYGRVQAVQEMVNFVLSSPESIEIGGIKSFAKSSGSNIYAISGKSDYNWLNCTVFYKKHGASFMLQVSFAPVSDSCFYTYSFYQNSTQSEPTFDGSGWVNLGEIKGDMSVSFSSTTGSVPNQKIHEDIAKVQIFDMLDFINETYKSDMSTNYSVADFGVINYDQEEALRAMNQ